MSELILLQTKWRDIADLAVLWKSYLDLGITFFLINLSTLLSFSAGLMWSMLTSTFLVKSLNNMCNVVTAKILLFNTIFLCIELLGSALSNLFVVVFRRSEHLVKTLDKRFTVLTFNKTMILNDNQLCCLNQTTPQTMLNVNRSVITSIIWGVLSWNVFFYIKSFFKTYFQL